MLRLVEFNSARSHEQGKQVFVNPEHVISVKPCNEDIVAISLVSGEVALVEGDCFLVVRALRGY